MQQVDTAETYMAAQLSLHPLMLNMDVQLATRKEPRTFFGRRSFYSAGKPGLDVFLRAGQMHLPVAFYRRTDG